MSWLKQIDINFVVGLIGAIYLYFHNHSWRVSQATGAKPPTNPLAPGNAPGVAIVLVVVAMLVGALNACHTPKERAVLHAEELCVPADLEAIREAIGAAKQTGQGTYVIEAAIGAFACNVAALGAKPPTGSGSSS